MTRHFYCPNDSGKIAEGNFNVGEKIWRTHEGYGFPIGGVAPFDENDGVISD